MAARTWSAAEKFRNNMTNKPKNIMPLIAVFTLIAATGAFAHNPNGKADPMNASQTSMLSEKHDADFDKAFLEMMPKHHHMAVEMAEQAEKKATHPELKELAVKIAKDQQQEIKQMKTWAQAWFGPA